MGISFVRWIVVASLISCGGSDLRCPDVAEIGSTDLLTCTYSNASSLSYQSPDGTNVVNCVKELCSDPKNGYALTRIDSNKSNLAIMNVTLEHEGKWVCQADQTRKDCSFVVSETPSCSIASVKNPTELDVNEEITLTASITDYYCSGRIDFLLKTGATTEDLKSDHSVETVTSDIFNSTFNVSDSHIGHLELLFSCNNVTKSVPCRGVKALLKKPPSCIITSDTNTDELDVGQSLSLSVYIEEYSCTHNTEYQLQIGSTTELKTNTTGACNKTITFTVTESHFGHVYLKVTCNDISRNVSTGGIKELKRRPPTTPSACSCTTGQTTTTCIPPETHGSAFESSVIKKYLVVIIAAAIGGVALIIAIALLVYFCWVKSRCKSSTSSKSSKRGNESCPYTDVADNVNSRPKSIRFDTGAYAEITDINGSFGNRVFDKESAATKNDIQIIPSGGYMSVDEFKKEAPQPYSSGLPQNSHVFRSDDVYSKVNKRSSSTSVNGQC